MEIISNSDHNRDRPKKTTVWRIIKEVVVAGKGVLMATEIQLFSINEKSSLSNFHSCKGYTDWDTLLKAVTFV
jgi:hypothetical protein